MEDVVREVSRDSTSSQTHIIIGDARRGTPDASNGQFVHLRDAADRWMARGGTFVVAVSLAPYKTVSSDPSGCRREAGQARAQSCPLYAFVFIPEGDEVRIASSLASVFESLFAWPSLKIPPSQLVFGAPRDRNDIVLDRRWATGSDSVPIGRTRGKEATNRSLPIDIELVDSSSMSGKLYRKLLYGAQVHVESRMRSLTPGAASQSWAKSVNRSALVSAESNGLRLNVITRGADAPRSIVQISIVADGIPNWLASFDATSASDVVKTYGLGRLFESFRQSGMQNSHEISTVYIVAN